MYIATLFNTEKWKNLLVRWSEMAKKPAEWIIEKMNGLRIQQGWKWSTVNTYMQAIIERREKGTEGLQKWMKHVRGEATIEVRATIKPFRQRHYDIIEADIARHPKPGNIRNLQIAILLSWVFAQRVSDVLQIHRSDVRKVTLPSGRFVHLIFRRGKTVKSNGIFSIHVPVDSPLTNWILELRNNTEHFIFQPNAPTTQAPGCLIQICPKHRSRLTKMIGEILRSVHPQLQVWSIRRGGAQRLAMMGLTPTEICRDFTHHADEKTLNSYLDNHLFDNRQAEAHLRVAKY